MTTPSFDAASDGGAASSSTSTKSWSHTVGSGSNRILIVTPGWDEGSSRSVSSITYNGVSLTHGSFAKVEVQVTTELNYIGTDFWYLLNPPTGTFTVLVTMSGACVLSAGAQSWADVDQTTPFGTPTTYSTPTPVSNPSINSIASVSGDVVIATMGSTDIFTDFATGQTQRTKFSDTIYESGTWIGASTTAAGSSTNMTYSQTAFTYGGSVGIGVALKGVSAGGGSSDGMILLLAA